MQPMPQSDRARHRPRSETLRDNRRLLRRAPMPSPRRSTQHLHATVTVPINWQITWQTIYLALARTRQDQPITAVLRKVGIKFRLRSMVPALRCQRSRRAILYSASGCGACSHGYTPTLLSWRWLTSWRGSVGGPAASRRVPGNHDGLAPSTWSAGDESADVCGR
jgi:hypothetical protein